MNQQSTNVLIVEDELLVALNLSKELEAQGYRVCDMVATEDEAFEKVQDYSPDVVLMDINLEDGGSGINAAKRIRSVNDVPVIFVTAYSSDKIMNLVGETNPYGYVLKPYNSREVIASIQTALRRFEFERHIKSSEERLKVAIKATDLAVLEYDKRDEIFSIEGESYSIENLGFSRHMSKGAFLARFTDLDAEKFNNALTNGTTLSCRMRLRKDPTTGINGFIDISLSDAIIDDGNIVIGTAKNVSAIQKDINQLRVSSSVISQMRESLVILDHQHNIKSVNKAFCDMIGIREEDLLNRPLDQYIMHSRKHDVSQIKSIWRSGQCDEAVEVTLRAESGNGIHVLLHVSGLELPFEQPQTIITITDVNELVNAERRMKKMAFSDPLTGLGNRAYLNHLLEKELKNYETQTTALLFVDLDEFKQVNDSYGHDVGDRILKVFSQRLSEALRDDDKLVRLGGDEFVLILNGDLPRSSLTKVAEKIIKLNTAPIEIGEQKYKLSCSIGIAYCATAEVDRNTLLKQADTAMYNAKRKGKNGFSFYNELQSNVTQFRLFVEQGLQQAIDNDEIMIWLQPIVDRDGNIKSAEALCRWYDDKAGFIPPDQFIAVAEENWLIHTLGERIIEQSMHAQRELLKNGFENIRININLSPKQLISPGLKEIFVSKLEQYKLSASQFTLEITESVLYSNACEGTLHSLRDMGFKIALDDFGTGYSSLSRLTDYDIDIIKIDGYFIKHLLSDKRKALITKTIVNLTEELGLKVVAECVETVQEVERLNQYGVDYMQGYFFNRPLPVSEFVKYLRTR